MTAGNPFGLGRKKTCYDFWGRFLIFRIKVQKKSPNSPGGDYGDVLAIHFWRFKKPEKIRKILCDLQSVVLVLDSGRPQ
jgi:hypothetical protein